MKKLIAIVAITASVLATPAFAQSFDKDFGTGNVQSFSYGSDGSEQTGNELPFSYGPGGAKQRWTVVAPQQNNQIAGRQSGLDAFAMVPGASSATDSNSPAATGGGSEGYNQELLIH